MQWFLLSGWSALILWGSRSRAVWLKAVLAAGLISAMGTQLLLLKIDGLLSWQAVLPLHLCSLFGCLSIPMLWHAPDILLEACCFLGAPSAFLTLFFPAILPCSHPRLMQAAFYQLHVLVALMPFYWHQTQKPLPIDPRRTLVLGSGYVAVISAFNRVFETNYLFLRSAPAGTPLRLLFSQGTAFYLCSLVIICTLVFSWLKVLYAHLRKYVII